MDDVDLSDLMVDAPVEAAAEEAYAPFDYPEPEYAPPDPEPEPEPKYGQDRRRQILLLQMYLNEFPAKLSAYKKTDLESLTMKELEQLLQEFQYILGAKQNVSAAVNAMKVGVVMLEKATTMFSPLQADGLSQVINTDQEAVDDMKCLALKYTSMMNVEPEVRLGMRVVQTALTLHAINTHKQAAAAPAAADTDFITDPPPPDPDKM